jgi:hypothetical protein
MPSTSEFDFPYPSQDDAVALGYKNIEDLAEAVEDQFLRGFQFIGRLVFTADGTFSKADPLGTGDIGLRAVQVTAVGSGGGGAQTTAVSGGGGGGAACRISFINVASLGASESVTIAAGGAGGDEAVGAAGGASSFGSLVIAGGGDGGRTDQGGPGGTGGTGDLVLAGQSGTSGSRVTLDGTRHLLGGGGSSGGGFGGGAAQHIRANFSGQNGRGFGGGGGGGVGSGQTGGDGFAGLVIVDLYA